jgi:hypothetical protein
MSAHDSYGGLMRRLLLLTIAVVAVVRPLNAQITVSDPANTARNRDLRDP